MCVCVGYTLFPGIRSVGLYASDSKKIDCAKIVTVIGIVELRPSLPVSRSRLFGCAADGITNVFSCFQIKRAFRASWAIWRRKGGRKVRLIMHKWTMRREYINRMCFGMREFCGAAVKSKTNATNHITYSIVAVCLHLPNALWPTENGSDFHYLPNSL